MSEIIYKAPIIQFKEFTSSFTIFYGAELKIYGDSYTLYRYTEKEYTGQSKEKVKAYVTNLLLKKNIMIHHFLKIYMKVYK